MGLDWCLENPCEAIDAPMVETEERAREMWDEYVEEQYNYESFEEFWESVNPENRDEPVADCEKCRVWEEYAETGRGVGLMAHPCEWRGKRLKYVGKYKVSWLVDAAYEDRTPAEMNHLADEIETLLLEDEENREYHQFTDEDIKTLREAVNWLRYWASQGVSMTAWY